MYIPTTLKYSHKNVFDRLYSVIQHPPPSISYQNYSSGVFKGEYEDIGAQTWITFIHLPATTMFLGCLTGPILTLRANLVFDRQANVASLR